MWNTYIAVDDVDAAAARASEARRSGPHAAVRRRMDAGRMTVVMDPTGAVVALWQAKGHIGATLVNEPGTLIWNELITDDGEAAAAFYGAVVGLTTESMDMGGSPYTVLKAGEEMVGGTMPPPMEGIPNHWHVYFAVESMDDALAKAGELGASVVAGPFDTPIGPMAALSDPQGAIFSLFAPLGEAQ